MSDRQPYATISDLGIMWRTLKPGEEERAEALLAIVSDALRQEAKNVGRDLDRMMENGDILDTVVKSVTVDIVARTLMTSTEDEPMTQFSQSALGYTVSGSYLVPGGGLFIKNSELKRLGLRRQRIGTMEIYENVTLPEGGGS